MLTSAQKNEVHALLASGQKIIAVKRYREITGVGLQEALYAVTQMSAGHADGSAASSASNASGIRAAPPLDTRTLRQAEAEALAAIREGNLLEAIKRYRAHTKVGLKEAKDAIDALSVVHRTSGRINAKLARGLLERLAAGKKQEAIDHLMSNVGYDEAEARAMINSLRTQGSGCAGGCLRLIIFIALLIAAWFGLQQAGLLS